MEEIKIAEQEEFARRLREIVMEPRFKMWLYDLLTAEIKKQNENTFR